MRKDLALGTTDLTLSVDVFNVLDDDTVVTQQTLGLVPSSTYPTARQFQLGARFAF
jgi:hypothetical protein